MLLILCPLDDSDTLAFAQRVRADGVPCRVLTAEALSFARRRSHRLSVPPGATGAARQRVSAWTEIEIPGVPVITDGCLTGVLNRLAAPPAAAWSRAAAGERDYASAEMYAFTLSWLASLRCPIRNSPTAGCLAGPAPHPLRQLAVARAVGLDCPPLRIGTRIPGAAADLGTAAMAAAGPGARVVQLACLDGTAPATRDAPVRRIDEFLAVIGAAQALVGMDFVVTGGRWIFAGSTPLPMLATVAAPLYRRLLAVLAAGPMTKPETAPFTGLAAARAAGRTAVVAR